MLKVSILPLVTPSTNVFYKPIIGNSIIYHYKSYWQNTPLDRCGVRLCVTSHVHFTSFSTSDPVQILRPLQRELSASPHRPTGSRKLCSSADTLEAGQGFPSHTFRVSQDASWAHPDSLFGSSAQQGPEGFPGHVETPRH